MGPAVRQDGAPLHCEICGRNAHRDHRWAWAALFGIDLLRAIRAVCASCEGTLPRWIGLVRWDRDDGFASYQSDLYRKRLP